MPSTSLPIALGALLYLSAITIAAPADWIVDQAAATDAPLVPSNGQILVSATPDAARGQATVRNQCNFPVYSKFSPPITPFPSPQRKDPSKPSHPRIQTNDSSSPKSLRLRPRPRQQSRSRLRFHNDRPRRRIFQRNIHPLHAGRALYQNRQNGRGSFEADSAV